MIDNIPRILPAHINAHIRRGSWPVPPLFRLVQEQGGIDPLEMARVFNLGIGMVVIISPEDLAHVQGVLQEETWVIGELVSGEKKVVID